MIVERVFENDENEYLKWVQHNIYDDLLWHLYQNAASHYLLDVQYIWVFPDFVPIIRQLKTFDHRVLQDGHDLIGAYYRFILCPHQNSVGFPDGFNAKEYYQAAWKDYYLQEVRLLGDLETIAEAIVTAVAFENTDRGLESERRLRDLLLQRYKSMPIINR